MSQAHVHAGLDGASLRNLGAAVPSAGSLQALTDAVNRRRVRVLELVRREHRGATGPAGAVVSLLDGWAAQLQAGRDEARTLLSDPFVGIWSEGLIRGERAIDEVGAIGRLLDASRVAGPRLEFDVELVDGALHLPRLGGTLLIGGSVATIRVEAGCLHVAGTSGRATFDGGRRPDLDGARWRPLHRISTVHGGCPLTVVLGSDDPAAASVGAAPAISLSEADHARWRQVLDLAWASIVTRHPKHVAPIQACCRVVVPQQAPDPTRHVSSSNADALGVIGLSFTEDVPTFALGIIHEARHAVLSAAMIDTELHVPDSTPRFYAGWRDDARPVGALLQGACAFSAVTDFWRAEREVAPDERLRLRFSLELERWYRLTTEALEQLGASGLLTPAGHSFLAGMADLTGERPEVEPLVGRAVGDLIAEHRVVWERRFAFGGSVDPVPPTTLAEAWRERLFGADEDGEVSRVDRALVGDDLGLALQTACDACGDGDGIGAGIRVARALYHLGDQRGAAALQAWIASTPSPDVAGLVAAGLARLCADSGGTSDLALLGDALIRVMDGATLDSPVLEPTQ